MRIGNEFYQQCFNWSLYPWWTFGLFWSMRTSSISIKDPDKAVRNNSWCCCQRQATTTTFRNKRQHLFWTPKPAPFRGRSSVIVNLKSYLLLAEDRRCLASLKPILRSKPSLELFHSFGCCGGKVDRWPILPRTVPVITKSHNAVINMTWTARVNLWTRSYGQAKLL